MSLQRLSVSHFRNINNLDIQLSDGVNLFCGENGSGKTSILEAINVLSTGRSFRTLKYKNVIQYGQDHYLLFAEATNSGLPANVAVRRFVNGDVDIRKQGKNCQSAAELAEVLPTRLIDGHSFNLFEGSPQIRRQYLDWLVFHVKHEFLQAWRQYQKCLKQRNSLLKRDKIDTIELVQWDRELARLGENLDQCRSQTFELLHEQLDKLLQQVDLFVEISVRYQRGWDADTPLLEYLEENRLRDTELGYTRSGPHRADLRVTLKNRPVVEVLSRGQQKALACSLLIAQGQVFQQQSDRQCIFLVDDMPAELDQHTQERVAKWLLSMGCQVFVTGIEEELLKRSWMNAQEQGSTFELKLFHVEHGQVKQEQG